MGKQFGAAAFKEKCLAILDELTSEGVIITKRGKPIAKLMPISSTESELIGKFKDKIKVKGDIFTTGVKWNDKP